MEPIQRVSDGRVMSAGQVACKHFWGRIFISSRKGAAGARPYGTTIFSAALKAKQSKKAISLLRVWRVPPKRRDAIFYMRHNTRSPASKTGCIWMPKIIARWQKRWKRRCEEFYSPHLNRTTDRSGDKQFCHLNF